MVIGRSCICARGLALARLRQVIGIWPSCSGVVPNSIMWRWANMREHLARREEPVRHVELVVGAAAADDLAARRGQAVPATGAAVELAEHQHRGRLPGQDRADRLADHRRSSHATGADLGPVRHVGQADGLDQVVVVDGVHVAADDAVDVVGLQAGVGDRGQRGLRRQRQVAAAGVAAVVGLADPDDRAAVPVIQLCQVGSSPQSRQTS